ncbi:hypothetical protein BGZ90_003143 [Linnemannia elongata]|nr:hypothetical protein BGZ90_003143 [Linnemannia elongata]
MEPLPPDPRTTKGITHEQRYYLCLKKQDCPAMKQSELAAWFLETYSFPISQPTISHSLKKSAEIIARGISTPGLEPTRVRRRPVRHPELEQALFQWVQQQQQEQGPEQSGEGSDPISGPALVRQAKKIAQEMDIHDTVFCPGWLSRFKGPVSLKTTIGITTTTTLIIHIIHIRLNVDIATARSPSNSNSSYINSSSCSQSLSRQYKLHCVHNTLALARYIYCHLQENLIGSHFTTNDNSTYNSSNSSNNRMHTATEPTDIDRFPSGVCGIFLFITFSSNTNIGDNSGDAPRVPPVYTHYYANQRNWVSPSGAILPAAFTALASHSRIPTSVAQ